MIDTMHIDENEVSNRILMFYLDANVLRRLDEAAQRDAFDSESDVAVDVAVDVAAGR